MSAETAQGIPRFESAPLIIPQGKQRCMLVAGAALVSASAALFLASASGSLALDSSNIGFDTRESQRKRLSCNTKVPYKGNSYAVEF